MAKHITKSGEIWISHRAHDWRQVAFKNKQMVCVICGATTTIGDWGVPRCRFQWATDWSGYHEED